jgi:mycofactocin precursor
LTREASRSRTEYFEERILWCVENAKGREDLMPGESEQASTATVPLVDVVPEERCEVEPMLALEDLLVEDVSIDGMCGVY